MIKCKYCKSKISLVSWILFKGACMYCDIERDKQIKENQHIKSKEFWNKKR